MKYFIVGALLSGVAFAGTVHASTVSETMVGTINGSYTTDTNGYFGPKNADLKGKSVSISVKYYTPVFNEKYNCQHYGCVEYLANNASNVSKSVSIKVTINGATQTFVPNYLGEVIVSPQGNIRIQSDAGSFPDMGIFVSIDVKGVAQFGSPLMPTLHDNQDYFTIMPSNNNSTEEPLSFSVKRAAP